MWTPQIAIHIISYTISEKLKPKIRTFEGFLKPILRVFDFWEFLKPISTALLYTIFEFLWLSLIELEVHMAPCDLDLWSRPQNGKASHACQSRKLKQQHMLSRCPPILKVQNWMAPCVSVVAWRGHTERASRAVEGVKCSVFCWLLWPWMSLTVTSYNARYINQYVHLFTTSITYTATHPTRVWLFAFPAHAPHFRA